MLNYLSSIFMGLFRRLYPRRYGASQNKLPQVLGFFLQPVRNLCGHYDKCGNLLQPQFLLTCEKENVDLDEEKWSCLDTPFSFLHPNVFIMASSNGLLLCSTDTEELRHYVVLNPITKECDRLPETHKSYKYAAMAFICEGDPRCLKGVDYQVVRAGVSNPKKCTSTLEIETFSSSTGEWEESSILCASPFYLSVSNQQALVYGELICWRELRCLIVVYNGAKNTVELMNLPGDAQNYISRCELLGKSEGKMQYARCDENYLEVWVLENFKEGEWVMKYKVGMYKINPLKGGIRETMGIEGFHPTKGRHILISRHGFRYWCNLETEKLESITAQREQHVNDYFLYEWPAIVY